MQAYRELNVVESARDGTNSQTQLCIDKKIKCFPIQEINGKLILGVLSLSELSMLTGLKNLGTSKKINCQILKFSS